MRTETLDTSIHYKHQILYVCDTDKHNDTCDQSACYINGGPCKCTAIIDYAKVGEKGRPIVALASDYHNDDF